MSVQGTGLVGEQKCLHGICERDAYAHCRWKNGMPRRAMTTPYKATGPRAAKAQYALWESVLGM